VGISYSWWMNKHTRHHAHPNQVDRDPDVEAGILCFVQADAASRRGAWSWLTAGQGLWFFPLLLLEGLNLHVESVKQLWVDRRTAGQRLESTGVLTRLLRYMAAVFLLLPSGLGSRSSGYSSASSGCIWGLVRPEPHRHADHCSE
jgi:fatty acid desaturase